MKTAARAWPEPGEDGAALPRIPAAQIRALKLLFWALFAPLAVDFALAPSFKIGATIAGILAVAAWIRRDLTKSSERV